MEFIIPTPNENRNMITIIAISLKENNDTPSTLKKNSKNMRSEKNEKYIKYERIILMVLRLSLDSVIVNALFPPADIPSNNAAVDLKYESCPNSLCPKYFMQSILITRPETFETDIAKSVRKELIINSNVLLGTFII